ncbi:MAG: caspase family protein [Bacteroidetes bacterium]|nr:caspase family protein [Bacteroidota bacterium]
MKGINLFYRLFLLICLVAFSNSNANAQCISGNCQNGSGTYRYSANSKYTGQFVNGLREGKGKFTYPNGNVYEGQFSRNKMMGEGTMYHANGDRYVGSWYNDQAHGKGIYYFKTRERYEGDFKYGEFEGFGVMYYTDGAYFTGNWKGSRKHGNGVLTKADGRTISGVWNMGKLQDPNAGQNVVDAAKPTNSSKPNSKPPVEIPVAKPKNKPDLNGLRDCSTNFCRSGNGYYTYLDGSTWVGEFKEGEPNGKGTCYYANGDRYEGAWLNNAPYGKGIMYFATGRVYGAEWVNGAPVKELDSQEEIPADPVRTENSKNVKIWALVVGVGSYTAMPTLKYTDDDANMLYAFLKSPEGGALPDNQVVLLVDEDATRQNILNTMRQLFLRADANDVVVLYFSGHGLDGCFLPVDYDGYNNKLRHEEIKKIFLESKAKHKLCIADACHSGSLNYNNGLAAKGPAPVRLERYFQAFEDAEGGIGLMMSSTADELSLEDQGLHHGVFTYFVLQGLKGKADVNNDYLITIKELYSYVYHKVRDYTAGAQSPVLTGTYDDAMPVANRQY